MEELCSITFSKIALKAAYHQSLVLSDEKEKYYPDDGCLFQFTMLLFNITYAGSDAVYNKRCYQRSTSLS